MKLTDFGLISALTNYPRIADKYRMRSVHYQAPEVVEGGVPTPVPIFTPWAQCSTRW